MIHEVVPSWGVLTMTPRHGGVGRSAAAGFAGRGMACGRRRDARDFVRPETKSRAGR